MLAGRDGAVADDVREGDEGGDAFLGRGESIDDGAVGGEEVARVAEALVVRRRGVAGEAVVAGGVVVLHGVPQRADEGDLVHDAGAVGQVLADAQAGDAGGDGFVFAADLGGGGGLHVEGVVVAGAAPLVEEDDRACAGLRGTRGAIAAEPGGRGQAGEAEGADLQEVTAIGWGHGVGSHSGGPVFGDQAGNSLEVAQIARHDRSVLFEGDRGNTKVLAAHVQPLRAQVLVTSDRLLRKR